MYDGHIYCAEYKQIKDIIAGFFSGDETDIDIAEVEEQVQGLYDEGKMSSTQYDDLMSYIQDIRESM